MGKKYATGKIILFASAMELFLRRGRGAITRAEERGGGSIDTLEGGGDFLSSFAEKGKKKRLSSTSLLLAEKECYREGASSLPTSTEGGEKRMAAGGFHTGGEGGAISVCS